MIRKLKRKDREELKRILAQTNHFSKDEIKIALELIDKYLNDKKQKDYLIYVYVIDDTKKVAGYICYGKRPLTEMTYDLYWIAVDPDAQGKGIGKSLIEFMEENLMQPVLRNGRQNGCLVLIETSGKESYRGERTFYEKNGYRIQTIIKNFYSMGDDLFIFRKYMNNLK
ncbi:MAG: GNAT family N-acetyltransferase [Ignavibacteria bacterium]